MNILIISYWDFQDEGMQVTQRTPLFFAEKGHNVTFMVHSETTARPSKRKDFHPRIRVMRFSMPLKWMNKIHLIRRIRQLILFGLFCIFNTIKLYRKGYKFDIIYSAEADAILIGAFIRHIFNLPFVSRFYGISRITSYFDFHSKKLRRMGIRNLFSLMAMKRPSDLAIITDDGSKGADIFRIVNPRTKNIKFWKNGVDKPIIKQSDIVDYKRSIGLKKDDFILLTLCRLDPWKGVDRAIRALFYLKKEGLFSPKLIIAGHGPELNNLIRLADELGISMSVIFIGAIPHDRVYHYYGMADIFLSLYRYSNVGNPLWEALNSGCCIVTLDTAATNEVIKDGINGKLLEMGKNENDLANRIADTIKELYLDPENRIRLSIGALEYARLNLWTWEDRLSTELLAISEIVPNSSPFVC